MGFPRLRALYYRFLTKLWNLGFGHAMFHIFRSSQTNLFKVENLRVASGQMFFLCVRLGIQLGHHGCILPMRSPWEDLVLVQCLQSNKCKHLTESVHLTKIVGCSSLLYVSEIHLILRYLLSTLLGCVAAWFVFTSSTCNKTWEVFLFSCSSISSD